MKADIQYEKPPAPISINRVGIAGVKAPLAITVFDGAKAAVLLEFNAFIDLPSAFRGIHASRSYEVLFEVFSEFVHSDAPMKIEDLCAKAARELLRRHEYATSSEVRARGEVTLKRATPRTGLTTFEPYKLLGRAIAYLSDGGEISIKKYVGVEVIGILACPCAKALVEEIQATDDAAPLIRSPYLGTHMQRSVGRVVMEVPEGYKVDAAKLMKVVESSFSSPTYGLLKREDEVAVVLDALSRPKFAEDAVRAIAEGIVKSFPHLPDEMRVVISQRSLESVHKHDMIAVKKATLGGLRAELRWNSLRGGRAI